MRIDREALGLINWPDREINVTPAVFVGSSADKVHWRRSVEICWGTMRATTRINSCQQEYWKDAFIPNGLWTKLPEDLERVFISENISGRPRCGLVRIEPPEIAISAELMARYPPETVSSGLPAELFTSVLRYVDGKFGATEQTIVNGAVWDRPGLETVTFNPQISKYLGLHIDSWDGNSFEDRLNSRTRICLNCGPGPRSFIYIPISIKQTCVALNKVTSFDSIKLPHEIIPALFVVFPNVPVLRLNIDPGTAYFADTDNLVHDGSSILADCPTLHYTVRGRFNAFL